MLREMAEAIEFLTAEHTLVLILEDLHWADYSTVDLLARIAQRTEPACLLVLATYRPSDAKAPRRGSAWSLSVDVDNLRG